VVLFPNCKINLGLHILHKRADGFHDLETVFYPIPLCDGLEVIHANNSKKETTITISGLPIDSKPEENICLKAYQLLKKDFDLPVVEIHLHKTIPIGAGLGGGSADGAFTLLLLNKKFNLKISEEKLAEYALELGSDCPFFIKNKACYATQRGEILKPVNLDLSPYKIVLINPGIHINTGWAFSQIHSQENRTVISEIIRQPITTWKNHLVNDFEEGIFKQHSSIKEIKEQLYKNGAVYASMSGSGSSIYGLFKKTKTTVFDWPENYFHRWIT
jgi:4-diphosphocytidyl-2-C-methyl-D-erythritol kinase